MPKTKLDLIAIKDSIEKEMEGYLSPPEAAANLFSLTCRAGFDLFAPNLNARRDALLKELLQNVINGNQDEVESILKIYPNLLLSSGGEAGDIQDYAGRKLSGTALQLALGALDFSYSELHEGMVEMIERFLKKLPNGEAIIRDQTLAQFPEDWETIEKEKNRRDKQALISVFEAIKISYSLEDCQVALQNFRLYLQSEYHTEIISTGKHFRHNILSEAMKIFYDRGKEFHPNTEFVMSVMRRAIYWTYVIGFIQRFLPANSLQAYSQGLKLICEENMPLDRTFNFNFRNDKHQKVQIIPLDKLNNHHLGYDGALACVGNFTKAARLNNNACFINFAKWRDDKCIKHLESYRPKSRCAIM